MLSVLLCLADAVCGAQATALLNAGAEDTSLLDRCVVVAAAAAPAACLDVLSCRHFLALLLPLAVPTTVVAVFLNWFCLKFFKHS